MYSDFLECSHRTLLLKDEAVRITAMFPETDCIKIATLWLLHAAELLIFHRLLKNNILRFYLINN